MENLPGLSGWLCMYSPEAWNKAGAIQYRQAAFPPDRAKSAKRMRIGAKIFAYISGVKKVAGILEISGTATVNPEVSEFGTPGQFPVVVDTKPLCILQPDKWLEMESMVGKLRLFWGLPNKKNWPMAIRLTPRELAFCDTQILTEWLSGIDKIN